MEHHFFSSEQESIRRQASGAQVAIPSIPHCVSSLFSYLENSFAAILHQPFRRGSGPTNADTPCTVKPFLAERSRRIYEISTGIDAAAGFKEDTPVAAFETAHKDDNIVASSEIADVEKAA